MTSGSVTTSATVGGAGTPGIRVSGSMTSGLSMTSGVDGEFDAGAEPAAARSPAGRAGGAAWGEMPGGERRGTPLDSRLDVVPRAAIARPVRSGTDVA